MQANRKLQQAKVSRNDEFYTQLEDIEKELAFYEGLFRDKTVFCNCDNPSLSAFWKYFHMNFEQLGLKKLTATHYEKENKSYKMEYAGGLDMNIKTGSRTVLLGDGSFQSPECLKLLNEADIVVTNPPFSLFREYIKTLVEYEKKFLILGNMNAVTYKEIFPLIRDNRIWYGASIHSGDREFEIPPGYDEISPSYRVDEQGRRYVRVNGVRWFTNLNYARRHEMLDLKKVYKPADYPKYDNYDAVNVNKTADIPADYDGAMGVPISFLDKYCPDQFDILGLSSSSRENTGPCHLGGSTRAFIQGKPIYARIFIRKR